jgi:hypothetical protein
MLLHQLTDQAAVLLAAVPDPGQGEAPPGSESLIKVIGWIAWIAFAACVVGVLKAGGLLAAMGIGNRGSSDHGLALGASIFGAIVCGSAAAIVTAVA